MPVVELVLVVLVLVGVVLVVFVGVTNVPGVWMLRDLRMRSTLEVTSA